MPTETPADPLGRRYITRDALMAKLGISDRRTITRLIDEEGLPCHRISERIIRFDPQEIDDWVRFRCTSPTPGQVA